MKKNTKYDKSFIVFSLLLVVCIYGWSGCYTQLATTSEPVLEPSIPVVDQNPPPEIYYPHPYYPPPPETDYPHPWNPPPAAGSISTATGTDSPAESPHRQSGYQRPPSTDQSNSRQADATPSRTSWSPAPAPVSNGPPPTSSAGTRTSGSTRGGR